MATVHVVGAGLAGLACAVRLTGGGRRVALHEAAGHAGGRCRSFHDAALGRMIDNGNHLLLGGNDATMAYLDAIGARDSLAGAPEPVFPFFDLRSGLRWALRPNRGRIPWWLFSRARRTPESRSSDYLAALRLARARSDQTVAEVLDTGNPFFERFWQPLAVAVLNTAPEQASARLLWPAVRLIFGRGGRSCRAYVARDGLSASLVDPALAWLAAHGCTIAFGARLRGLERGDDRIRRLDFGEHAIDITEGDRVVLALPPARAAALLPGIDAPRESRAIVNGHFLLPREMTLPEGAPFLGLIGGAAQWLFLRGDVASVTVSAADAMADDDSGEIAARLWADVARALDLGARPLPAHRIVKERRATFAQTPAETARRPPARTRWNNLFLAGDWTDTGLPATIESA
ncbi:MAG: hydroxysqualene dehydroxylase HpnE, partial [Alphaproteobacteria bacterium]